VTNADAQTALAVDEGLMPSRQSVYDSAKLKDAYPADLLELYSTSVDNGGPRPKSAFYSQISSALQSRWHSPSAVGPGTPAKSAAFLKAILGGKALL
jgi:multiple sugar transport system substrate-binding protein